MTTAARGPKRAQPKPATADDTDPGGAAPPSQPGPTGPTLGPVRGNNLPPLDNEMLPTPWHDAAVIDISFAVLDNAIAVVFGPAGVGKTTTVASVLAKDRTITTRYANMPHTARVKDSIDVLHESLGLQGRGPRGALAGGGSARDMRIEIVQHLANGGIALVVDEIHHVSQSCMLTISQIWEQVRARNGVGFPFFLIGANAPAAIRFNAELFTRISYPIRLDVLQPHDVLRVARHLSGRCDLTDDEALLHFDARLGHGNLRTWKHFIHSVERLPALRGEPVSDTELKIYIDKHEPLRGNQKARQ